MKITIDTSNPQEVQEALAYLSGGSGQNTTPQAAPAPAPQPAAAPAPQAAPAPAPEPAPQQAPAAAPAPTPAAAASQADLSAAVQAYAQANGPKNAKAKLAELGFGKTADVPPDQYATVIAALQG